MTDANNPEFIIDDSQLNISMLTNIIAPLMKITETFNAEDTLRLSLEDETLIKRQNSTYIYSFAGYLLDDSQTVYAQLDEALQTHDAYALLRAENDAFVLHILQSRISYTPRIQQGFALLLLLITFVSVLYTGMIIALGEISLEQPRLASQLSENVIGNLWRGLPYAFAILLILGAHELGHYFMMRRYRVQASVPYFIPSFGVTPFGTFGAVIILRGAIQNRRHLFDIGVAGPIAGLIFAVPILLIGLATSQIIPITGNLVEGNSIFYAFAKIITLGQFYPSNGQDVILNQWAWAGWTGLFVTALNLIPVGQLDGGHIIYALVGERARGYYWALIGILAMLLLFVSQVWLVFLILLALMGRFYAVPLDAVTPLDKNRTRLGWAMLIVFVLIFIPNPIGTYDGANGLLSFLLIVQAGLLHYIAKLKG